MNILVFTLILGIIALCIILLISDRQTELGATMAIMFLCLFVVGFVAAILFRDIAPSETITETVEITEANLSHAYNIKVVHGNVDQVSLVKETTQYEWFIFKDESIDIILIVPSTD